MPLSLVPPRQGRLGRVPETLQVPQHSGNGLCPRLPGTLCIPIELDPRPIDLLADNQPLEHAVGGRLNGSRYSCCSLSLSKNPFTIMIPPPFFSAHSGPSNARLHQSPQGLCPTRHIPATSRAVPSDDGKIFFQIKQYVEQELWIYTNRHKLCHKKQECAKIQA